MLLRRADLRRPPPPRAFERPGDAAHLIANWKPAPDGIRRVPENTKRQVETLGWRRPRARPPDLHVHLAGEFQKLRGIGRVNVLAENRALDMPPAGRLLPSGEKGALRRRLQFPRPRGPAHRPVAVIASLPLL